MPVFDVHIVAHTHDDTGYLNTIDEYYESNVRFILTTVVEQLKRNPTRRFTYVEVAFFDRWWSEQTDSVKQDVRDLVAAKQLEFANGGWYVLIVETCTVSVDCYRHWTGACLMKPLQRIGNS